MLTAATEARPLPSALLLAAGLGTRMRPLTAHAPKPLLVLAGRTLLDRALDRIAEAGIARVVVNAHWQADRLEAHLLARADAPATVLFREPALLGAGGTLAAVLARGLLPADRPTLVANGDSVFFDGPEPTIRRLIDGFDARDCDALLMLVRTAAVRSDIRNGDFMLDPLGVLRRPEPAEVSPFLYAGLQILSPRLFADPSDAPPPGMNALWDRALARGRLHGLVHDGDWHHLSVPADLAEAELLLARRVAGHGV